VIKHPKTILATAAVAVAAVAGATTGGARADAGGGCVGQFATSNAGPQYGLVAAGFAQAYQPFGANVVSYNATSPPDACPF